MPTDSFDSRTGLADAGGDAAHGTPSELDEALRLVLALAQFAYGSARDGREVPATIGIGVGNHDENQRHFGQDSFDREWYGH